MSTALQQRTPLASMTTRRGALASGLAATLSLLLASYGQAETSSSDENPLANPRLRIAHLLRRAGFGAT